MFTQFVEMFNIFNQSCIHISRKKKYLKIISTLNIRIIFHSMQAVIRLEIEIEF